MQVTELFTLKEILLGIFSLIGTLGGTVLWFFLDNRKGHRVLHDRISEHDRDARSNLLTVYQFLAGKEAQFPRRKDDNE